MKSFSFEQQILFEELFEITFNWPSSESFSPIVLVKFQSLSSYQAIISCHSTNHNGSQQIKHRKLGPRWKTRLDAVRNKFSGFDYFGFSYRFSFLSQRWFQRSNQRGKDHQQPTYCCSSWKHQICFGQRCQVCCKLIVSSQMKIMQSGKWNYCKWFKAKGKFLIEFLSYVIKGLVLSFGSPWWQQKCKVHNGPSRRWVEETSW